MFVNTHMHTSILFKGKFMWVFYKLHITNVSCHYFIQIRYRHYAWSELLGDLKLFWPFHIPGLHRVHKYICRQNIDACRWDSHTYKIIECKLDNFKISLSCGICASVLCIYDILWCRFESQRTTLNVHYLLEIFLRWYYLMFSLCTTS